MFFRLASPEVARTGGSIMALGLALLAISFTYKTFLENLIGIKLDLLEDTRIRLGFFSLALIGALIVFVWLAFWTVQHLLIRFPTAALKRFQRLQSALDHLSLAPCTDANLAAISTLAQQEFGSLAASLERNRWLSHLVSTAYVKVIDHNGRIVAFYDVLRLTKMGADAANRGEFNITTCPQEYIRNDTKRRYNYVYIGGVYGRNKKAKAMVLGAIYTRILELRPRVVFARAGTKDGLRLLEQESFRPTVLNVTGLGAMYSNVSK
jgi:hypothetical protein